MAEADDRDDGGGFHKVEMPAMSAQERPNAVGVSRGGAERNQGVHIGLPALELPPGSLVKARAGEYLHQSGQPERQPSEPRGHPQAKNPFAEHQQQRARQAKPQARLPAASDGDSRPGVCRRRHGGLIPGLFNRGDNTAGIILDPWLPLNRKRAPLQIHIGRTHPGNAAGRLADMAGAVGASHAFDQQPFASGSRPRLGRHHRLICIGRSHSLLELNRAASPVQSPLPGGRIKNTRVVSARPFQPWREMLKTPGQPPHPPASRLRKAASVLSWAC